ncbi:3785_t:CDS:2, partial [Ambispora leptoticha]
MNSRTHIKRLKVTAACFNCRKKKRGNADVIKTKANRVEDLFDTISEDYLSLKEKEIKNQVLESIDGIPADVVREIEASKNSMKFHNPYDNQDLYATLPRLVIPLQNHIIMKQLTCAKCAPENSNEIPLPENQIYQQPGFSQQLLPPILPNQILPQSPLQPISTITSTSITNIQSSLEDLSPIELMNNGFYLVPFLPSPDEMLRGSVPAPDFFINDEELSTTN